MTRAKLRLDLPPGVVLIRDIQETQIERKPPRTGTWPKWTVIDSNGQEHVTTKKQVLAELTTYWKAERPVNIVSVRNQWSENIITEINPMPLSDDDEPWQELVD